MTQDEILLVYGMLKAILVNRGFRPSDAELEKMLAMLKKHLIEDPEDHDYIAMG